MSGGWANSPEDEDDEDDEEIERAEDEASSPGGVADATPGVTVDKRAVKNRAAEAEKELDSDIAEAQDALELFLNSRFAEAERRLSAKNGRSLYHTLGYATISYLRALFTFDPSDVRKATESLRNAVEIAAIYKKETSLVSSFTSMMTRSKEGSHIKHMTKLQRHAELVHAEAHLAKSMLSLITDSNIIAFVREGLNIRAAYNSYKNCYKFLQRTYDEEGGAQGLAKAGIDEHFVSGILLGIGAFNLSLSMMPAKVLRLFELIGFSGDRDFGLSRLEIGGEWPIRNRAGIYDHKVKPAARVRKALCDLVLLGYHIILSSLVQLPDCDMDFAKQILAYNLERHPNSFIFLAMRARVAQTEGNPAQAISEYKRVIEIQNEWRQLVHLCIWDSATCYGALGNWSDAHDMHETLFKESKWSKAIYKYLQAISLYAQDINGDKKEQVGEMLKEVPKLTKKIAGKSIPMEKFVSRKCRKWQLQGGRLFLPHFEMLYIMNGFD
ncbi:outer membrane protein Iml2/Tetratricopeptide repeat protein 39, partial [Fimicolochytrium jonesii]|uniref:outer membrane protein Iml2/Tetratricopeptide repeat protein 39 n=1 Tax=Fimicolochytrium jonesii TaxID=1396493 RepID=UPI0022FE212D